MPGISGPQLVRAIRSREKLHTECILYSGMSADELDELAKEHEILGSVVKTENIGGLGAAFAPLLAIAASRVAARAS